MTTKRSSTPKDKSRYQTFDERYSGYLSRIRKRTHSLCKSYKIIGKQRITVPNWDLTGAELLAEQRAIYQFVVSLLSSSDYIMFSLEHRSIIYLRKDIDRFIIRTLWTDGAITEETVSTDYAVTRIYCDIKYSKLSIGEIMYQ